MFIGRVEEVSVSCPQRLTPLHLALNIERVTESDISSSKVLRKLILIKWVILHEILSLRD